MKRTLIAMALLLCLALSGLIAAHVWVNAARDQVEMTETVLAGDAAAAEGVAITYRTGDRYWHLRWDTAFAPGRAEEAETDFHFSARERGREIPDWSRGELYISFPGGISSSGTIDLEAYQREGGGARLLARMAADVAEKTEAGKGRTEELRFADYSDHYPLTFDAWSANLSASYDSESNGYLGKYFRIPADPDQMVEVEVRKEPSGGVTYIGANFISSSIPWVWSESVVAEEGIYLAANAIGEDGTDQLQCQRGIHFVPLDTSDPNWFNPKGFRLFYPTEAEILHLHANQDNSRLMLYTREAGKLVLTMVDRATGEAAERLELADLPAEESVYEPIDRGDLHIAVLTTGEFCLLQEEAEGTAIALRGTMDMEDEAQRILNDDDSETQLSWDGERLVWTAGAWNDSGGRYLRPLAVSVWGADGLRFLGTYQYGPQRDPAAANTSTYGVISQDPVSIGVSYSQRS